MHSCPFLLFSCLILRGVQTADSGPYRPLIKWRTFPNVLDSDMVRDMLMVAINTASLNIWLCRLAPLQQRLLRTPIPTHSLGEKHAFRHFRKADDRWWFRWECRGDIVSTCLLPPPHSASWSPPQTPGCSPCAVCQPHSQRGSLPQIH